MAIIGYARISPDEQDMAAQHDGLEAVGCVIIFENKASGASGERPQLDHHGYSSLS